MQRIPKLRGFKNPFRVDYTPVNLDALAALEADEVTRPRPGGGRAWPGARALVKVLGRGEVEPAAAGFGPCLLGLGRGGHHRGRG